MGLLSEDIVAYLLEQRGYETELARATAAAASGSIGRALSLNDEELADRESLLTDFESFCSTGSPDLASLVDDLNERTRSNRHGLSTLLEWQLRKVTAALGYARYENCDRLAAALSGCCNEDAGALLNQAERIHWTMGALASRANAKLAIRDLLIDIRQR